MLRVYYPRKQDYDVKDLMLEQQLDAPILQVEAGRFLGSDNRLGLAVLQPRK